MQDYCKKSEINSVIATLCSMQNKGHRVVFSGDCSGIVMVEHGQAAVPIWTRRVLKLSVAIFMGQSCSCAWRQRHGQCSQRYVTVSIVCTCIRASTSCGNWLPWRSNRLQVSSGGHSNHRFRPHTFTDHEFDRSTSECSAVKLSLGPRYLKRWTGNLVHHIAAIYCTQTCS